MKSKIVFILSLLFSATATTWAQTARQVLDKAAATVSNPAGVEAKFVMTGGMGNVSGSIQVKGTKFHAVTPVATIWFDGKTQWTYLKKNDEVNISTPSESQLQAVNPYRFVNLYKQGYKYTMNKSAAATYIVHLTATDSKNKIKEAFITVDKSSYVPRQVKLLQGQKWTTFDVTDLKKKDIPDDVFRFSAKDYPTAEVVDLR